MKWTYDWLCDYLKTDASAADIADTLTRIGLEIEELTMPTHPIAAKIIECNAHPDSDHLHVLRVDDGTGTMRQVVCGAPNARVGLVSALALPGCVIDGHEIKSGKLRGVISDGMMCSGRELGINNDHDGIIELDETAEEIGKTVSVLRDMCAVTFDAGITPNRPDYLAVRGIAWDLAAAGAGEYIAPNDDVLGPVSSGRGVHIETDRCPVYRLAEIHGITVAPSDKKIASRMAAIGINPKNAPVDATNYICYDMGQPMHCFDADEINGDITVRMARDGEEFTDLFGNLHELKSTDIVITDATGILALAGVIGGARGATTQNTKNIILESAYFDPVSVRKTSKRLGISTDASYRYERGINPTTTGPALKRAADIIMARCGGKIVNVAVSGRDPVPSTRIEYTPDMFRQETGIDMDADVQRGTLERLGYEIVANGKKWRVTPPVRRVDVEIAETIIADLIRIYGYDKIATSARHSAAVGACVAHDENELNIKRLLVGRGLNECQSFGFGNAANEQLLTDKNNVKIANPITAELDTARNNILQNLLIAVRENTARGYADLSLFEIGTVFDGDMPGDQHTQLCIVRSGTTGPRHWTGRNRPVDIFDTKADLYALMRGANCSVSDENPPRWAHPYRYGAIVQGKKKIAEFGELHPMVAKRLKIKTNVVIAIVDDTSALPTKARRHMLPISEFQPITRDFAFITDADTAAEKIVSAARGADARITDVTVFDAFDMADGKRSIGLTITITPTDNMSDGELMKIQNAVIDAVSKKTGAQIRDK